MYHKEEWLREYHYHLALVHGISLGIMAVTPLNREKLQKFWRTLGLPENPQPMEHRLGYMSFDAPAARKAQHRALNGRRSKSPTRFRAFNSNIK